MPYFKKINTLFIHIPKTGGTSVENYFYKKFNIEKTFETLFSTSNQKINGHSLQHCTYQELIQNNKYFSLDLKSEFLKIISVVRNPYNRIVSDLFFLNLITPQMNTDEIFKKIKFFLNSSELNFDAHKREQYKYLIDEYQQIPKKITVLKTETLTNEMQSIGYIDFDYKHNVTHMEDFNYMDFLNNDSLNLINKYYEKDFIYFNYEIVTKK